MDRKIFKLPFSKSGLTKFHCPTCGQGVLKVKDDTFHFQETESSAKAHGHEGWDPDWIKYIYSCLLECTNSACNDIVSSSGNGSITESYGYDEEGMHDIDYVDFFRPYYFTPHLKMFDVPKDTPEPVLREVNTSFSLIFCDPASSANHIRVALEHLLTHLKVKRFNIKNGKRSFLMLHKRIELLPVKFDHIKDLFFAIKWLGNAGSHSNHEVSLDDVLDSYELMNELFIEIFSKHRIKAKSLANKINKKKGPK